MPAPDRRRQRIMDHGTDPALTQFVGHGLPGPQFRSYYESTIVTNQQPIQLLVPLLKIFVVEPLFDTFTLNVGYRVRAYWCLLVPGETFLTFLYPRPPRQISEFSYSPF